MVRLRVDDFGGLTRCQPHEGSMGLDVFTYIQLPSFTIKKNHRL